MLIVKEYNNFSNQNTSESRSYGKIMPDENGISYNPLHNLNFNSSKKLNGYKAIYYGRENLPNLSPHSKYSRTDQNLNRDQAAHRNNNHSKTVDLFKFNESFDDLSKNQFISIREKLIEVNKILKKMKNKRIKPDYDTYRAMIKIISQSNDEYQMNVVLENIKQSNINLNLDSYNSLIDFFVKVQNEDKVNELLKNMKNENIHKNKKTYDTLISFYKKIFKPQNIEQLGNEVMYGYMHGSLNSDDVLNIYLITNFSSAESFLEVIETKKIQFDPNIYKEFLYIYIKNKDTIKIEKTMEKLKLHGVMISSITYNCIFDFYIKNQDVVLARKLFCEMKANYVTVDDYLLGNYFNLLFFRENV
jgi:pentatricopeptide repeat protein